MTNREKELTKKLQNMILPKVSERNVHYGLLLNSRVQTRVWVNESRGTKDKRYQIVFNKMKKKYPELTDEEIKDNILLYL